MKIAENFLIFFRASIISTDRAGADKHSEVDEEEQVNLTLAP